jgi:hypothetical protein
LHPGSAAYQFIPLVCANLKSSSISRVLNFIAKLSAVSIIFNAPIFLHESTAHDRGDGAKSAVGSPTQFRDFSFEPWSCGDLAAAIYLIPTFKSSRVICCGHRDGERRCPG